MLRNSEIVDRPVVQTSGREQGPPPQGSPARAAYWLADAEAFPIVLRGTGRAIDQLSSGPAVAERRWHRLLMTLTRSRRPAPQPALGRWGLFGTQAQFGSTSSDSRNALNDGATSATASSQGCSQGLPPW